MFEIIEDYDLNLWILILIIMLRSTNWGIFIMMEIKLKLYW